VTWILPSKQGRRSPLIFHSFQKIITSRILVCTIPLPVFTPISVLRKFVLTLFASAISSASSIPVHCSLLTNENSRHPHTCAHTHTRDEDLVTRFLLVIFLVFGNVECCDDLSCSSCVHSKKLASEISISMEEVEEDIQTPVAASSTKLVEDR
jgi:hypothetical protein